MTSSKLVLVDGATGYLGGHIVARFLAAGMRVRALVRSCADGEKLAYLNSLPVEIVTGDLDSDQATSAFAGVDIAVHLIGSIAPRRSESFESLHIESSRKFARLANASVSRVIMVTALGADKGSTSAYLRSKAQAEEAMRESLGATPLAILRPSLIVGRVVGTRDSKLVKRYLQFLRSARPFVPLIGGGKNLIQPVFVEDLAAAAVKVAEQGKEGVFEIGGPEALSMRHFVKRLCAAVDIDKSLLDVPYPLAMLGARLLHLVSDVPALSCDQARLSCFDNICRENALFELIGAATPLDSALSTYREVSRCPGAVS